MVSKRTPSSFGRGLPHPQSHRFFPVKVVRVYSIRIESAAWVDRTGGTVSIAGVKNFQQEVFVQRVSDRLADPLVVKRLLAVLNASQLSGPIAE